MSWKVPSVDELTEALGTFPKAVLKPLAQTHQVSSNGPKDLLVERLVDFMRANPLTIPAAVRVRIKPGSGESSSTSAETKRLQRTCERLQNTCEDLEKKVVIAQSRGDTAIGEAADELASAAAQITLIVRQLRTSRDRDGVDEIADDLSACQLEDTESTGYSSSASTGSFVVTDGGMSCKGTAGERILSGHGRRIQRAVRDLDELSASLKSKSADLNHKLSS